MTSTVESTLFRLLITKITQTTNRLHENDLKGNLPSFVDAKVLEEAQ